MKNSIVLIAAMILATVFVSAQNHQVSATITKLENRNGKVLIELVDEAGNTVQEKAVNLDSRSCKVVFNDVKTGAYAIRYYHDENNNGIMDTGSFGIPKEGYGFSNDARGFMGPPDFEDMLFSVHENVEMTLKTVN